MTDSSPSRRTFAACFTVDVEQDCPPYLNTHRGMTEGLPRLLDLLGELRIRGTFFTTGEMARRFPAGIARLVAEAHELGCHGDLHRDFTRLGPEAADAELAASLATLRAFGPVTSFRAPYLRFPAAYLPLLGQHQLRFDSSVARYKSGANHRLDASVPGLTRIPASVTSSVLRLPRLIRAWLLRGLKAPPVLFVHPWEAADFRTSRLRWDCRFRTGETAVRLWRDVLRQFQGRGARFVPLQELAPMAMLLAAFP